MENAEEKKSSKKPERTSFWNSQLIRKLKLLLMSFNSVKFTALTLRFHYEYVKN